MIWRSLVEDPRVPDMEAFVQEIETQRQLTVSEQMDKEIFEKLCLLPAQVGKSTYTWNIDQFSIYKNKNLTRVLTSESFTNDINHTKWSLDIQFKYNPKSLSLVLVSCNEHRVHTKAVLSVSSVVERKSVSNTFYKSFALADNKHSWDVSRPDIFCSKNGDKLKVTCEIEAIPEANLPKFKHPKRPLLQTYMRDNVPYDVTLCVGDEELPAHKMVLACHSPVLQAMLQHEMLEKASSRIDISDFEPRVIRELLEFMYMGSSQNLEAMAPKLLAAADKYRVEKLKVLCEVQMFRRLNRKNVVETLKLAELHNAHQLRASVLDFITINAHDIVKSVILKLSGEQDPRIKAALIEKYASIE